LLNTKKEPYLHKATLKQGQKWKIPRSQYMNRGSNKGSVVG
jgi:hypothetical protein